MKTRSLFFPLLLTSTAALAADPPKFVPRPIPGMAAPAPVKAASALMKPVSAQLAATAPGTNPDRARILYIHRRATLPEEFTKGLPTAPSEATAPAAMLNVHAGAVKIIPKSEVVQALKPKS